MNRPIAINDCQRFLPNMAGVFASCTRSRPLEWPWLARTNSIRTRTSRRQLTEVAQSCRREFAFDLLGLAERVAGCDGTVIQAGFEPVRALLGRAMGERFRTDMAGGHFLQVVITDGGGGAQRGLHVSAFEQAALLSGMRPDTSKTVCLEFQF